MTTVLIPLDGSRFAERALAAVPRIAAHDRVSIVLLQVVAPVNPVRLDRVIAKGSGRTVQARQHRATRYLERIAARLARRGVGTVVRVTAGAPATQILRAAREARVALIAMSTHGRTGLRRALMGSVAEEVVRRSPLPVLLVRGLAMPVARRGASPRARRTG